MSAMMSAPYSSIDFTWYPDSGASNHLTFDPNNLMTKTSYTGTEKIHIGDRSCLDIHHIGCSSFKLSFNSKFHLLINYYMCLLSLKIFLVSQNLLLTTKFILYYFQTIVISVIRYLTTS